MANEEDPLLILKLSPGKTRFRTTLLRRSHVAAWWMEDGVSRACLHSCRRESLHILLGIINELPAHKTSTRTAAAWPTCLNERPGCPACAASTFEVGVRFFAMFLCPFITQP